MRPRRPARGTVLWQSFVVQQLMSTLLDRVFEPTGIERRHVVVLHTIRALTPVTPSELALSLGMPPSTLSAVLAELESADRIRRARRADDRRSHVLELTAPGRQAADVTSAAVRGVLGNLRRHLEAPLDEIEVALEELERALRKTLADSSDPK